MHFQIISVVSPNYTVVLSIISVVLRNHTDDLGKDEVDQENTYNGRKRYYFR